MGTNGIFITFEGGEGAGKSTLSKNLTEWIKAEGRAVVHTREPGGTALGEEVRKWLLHRDGTSARAELFLLLAARVQHIEEVIKPALKAGHVVLCDRFTDSTIAYQGVARGLGAEYVSLCSESALLGFGPDLTFLLDIDPVAGLERVGKGRGKGFDRIEDAGLEFHQKVRKGFLAIAQASPARVCVLDATLSESKLLEMAKERMQELLIT